MVPKHVAFAPGNKWGQEKMGPGPIFSLSVPIYSQGFALLSLLERLLRRFAPRNARSAFLAVFSPYSLRQARDEKKGPVPFFPSSLTSSELHSRREKRMENGVKNLIGSETTSQNLLVAF